MINRRRFLRLLTALPFICLSDGKLQPSPHEYSDSEIIDARIASHDGVAHIYLLGPDGTVWVSDNWWDYNSGAIWNQVCTCDREGCQPLELWIDDPTGDVYIIYEDGVLSRYYRDRMEWEEIGWQITLPC